MAFEGELLNQCSTLGLDFSSAKIVAVSGDGPNFCGHMLIAFGPVSGGFNTCFHVAGLYSRPRYMSEEGFQRYLKETGKQQLNTMFLNLPKPIGAQNYLCGLMAKKWIWGVIPNNCVAFVEEIVLAGGAEWSSRTNCPAVAVQPTLNVQINNFLNEVNRSIYRLYGVEN